MPYRCLAIAAFSIITGTGLVACAPDTLPPIQGSAESSSPTTGGRLDAVPESAGSASQVTAGLTPRSYICTHGATVQASYPTVDTAVVVYQGQTYHLQVAVSADGARYTGNEYEWWARGTGPGSEASLYTHRDDGSTGPLIEKCHEK